MPWSGSGLSSSIHHAVLCLSGSVCRFFSLVIREEPETASDFLPSRHPQASFWPHYKVWLEAQVSSLQSKFGSAFEMLCQMGNLGYAKLPRRLMRSLKATVTVN